MELRQAIFKASYSYNNISYNNYNFEYDRLQNGVVVKQYLYLNFILADMVKTRIFGIPIGQKPQEKQPNDNMLENGIDPSPLFKIKHIIVGTISNGTRGYSQLAQLVELTTWDI